MKTRRIALQRMTVCAAPSYLKAQGTPLQLDDLQQHQAVVYGRGGMVKPWLFPGEDRDEIEIVPPNRLRLDDLSAISDAAVDGLGLAWLPCWLIRNQLRAGELVPVLLDRPRLIIETHALWPEAPHLPLRVRLAIDALAASLPSDAEL